MTAREIIDIYISFFEKRGHKRIPDAPLIPENDPTTLFTSSGMQPLIPYFLGEPHPMGKRLVNVQDCFRTQDIEEVGDNRHITFFRMLGNWSLGDYFKKEQLSWFFEFLTKELGLLPEKIYVSVFNGFDNIPKDENSALLWKELFENVNIDSRDRIFYYGLEKNWWSRTGTPDNMPIGEPGGPDSEVFFDFRIEHNSKYKKECHINCNCGRYLEIGNSVFMQYQRQKDGFSQLPQKNVDFGGGLERLLAAVENNPDIFQTSLFAPIIKTIEHETQKDYQSYAKNIRIITDHFIASVFIANTNVVPSNKEQGYVLRRLIRRGLDNFYKLEGKEITPILESIVDQYKQTDSGLVDNFEEIKLKILEEEENYNKTLGRAKQYILRRYNKVGDELLGVVEISAPDAFILYSTHGLSPTQIENLGFVFDKEEFAEKMKEHKTLSKKGAMQKFAGGLADNSEKTIMGHTATHLLHQALKDLLWPKVKQKGSNITSERIRFDFNFDRKLTDGEIRKIEKTVNDKIREGLGVHFEIIPISKAKEIGAIGLFEEKYQQNVKVYFIGNYSKEICGGPHVKNTQMLEKFTIIKQENIGKGQRRIYAKIGV